MAVRELGNAVGNALALPRASTPATVSTPQQVVRHFRYSGYPPAPSTYYNVDPMFLLDDGSVFVDYVGYKYSLNTTSGFLTPQAQVGGSVSKTFDGNILSVNTSYVDEVTPGSLSAKRYAITNYDRGIKLFSGDYVLARSGTNTIARVNAAGAVQWTKVLAGNANTTITLQALRPSADGGFYCIGHITGTYFVTNTTALRAFVCKFDSSGNLLSSITLEDGSNNLIPNLNTTTNSSVLRPDGTFVLVLIRGSQSRIVELNPDSLAVLRVDSPNVTSGSALLGAGSTSLVENSGSIYRKTDLGYTYHRLRYGNIFNGTSVQVSTSRMFNDNFYVSLRTENLTTTNYSNTTARPVFTIVENLRYPVILTSGPVVNDSDYGFIVATMGLTDSSGTTLTPVSVTYTLTNTTAVTCTFSTQTLTVSPTGPTVAQATVTTS
jgi:hypothetical protein